MTNNPDSSLQEIEIPKEFEEWIRQWLRENVVTRQDPSEDIDITLDRHNAKTTWAWAIAIAAYRHFYYYPSPRWINIESPPEEYIKVLLYWNGLKEVETGYLINGSWVGSHKKPFWTLPSHWMRLPPLPSGK